MPEISTLTQEQERKPMDEEESQEERRNKWPRRLKPLGRRNEDTGHAKTAISEAARLRTPLFYTVKDAVREAMKERDELIGLTDAMKGAKPEAGPELIKADPPGSGRLEPDNSKLEETVNIQQARETMAQALGSEYSNADI